MPLPVIGDVFRVAMIYQAHAGLTAVNVMNVRAPALADVDISASFDTNWTLGQLVLCGSSLNMVRLETIKLDGVSPTHIFGVPSEASGSGGADTIPASAAIVSIRTGVRGPRGRGRLFLPFVAEGTQADGTLNESNRATCAAAWSDFFIALAADGITPGVASYKHSTFEPWTTVNVDPVVGTVRARLERIRP